MMQNSVELLDQVCYYLENLEWFSYKGSSYYGIKKKRPKIPDPEDEGDIFTNLKYIFFQVSIYDKEDPLDRDEIIDNFKNCLLAKCPRLTNSLQVNDDHDSIVIFESRFVETQIRIN